MIKNFYYKMIKLSQLKTLEIQFYLCAMYFGGLEFSIQILKDKTYFQLYLDLYILKLNLNFSRRCDHQGIDLKVLYMILKHLLNFNIYYKTK